MSMPLAAVLVAIALAALSGVPGLFLSRERATGQQLAAALVVLAAVLGIGGTIGALTFDAPAELRAPWSVPGGELHVVLDGLSAVFLLQVWLLSACGAVYGLAYWRQQEHPTNGRRVTFFFGLLTASLALMLVARNAILFLVGWEGMAIAAFAAMTAEDQEPAVRDTGHVYLASTRVSTYAIFAFFASLFFLTGQPDFAVPKESALSPTAASVLFILALIGFGTKAGMMPLHLWLPAAHANAPSHVSALMSGALIKLGVYGLMRTVTILPDPPIWWGGLILGLGLTSGVLGVAFALGQHDLKRLLAYHSVENIGIILIGLGLALLGRSFRHPELVVLGFAGSVLHVLNHGLFKGLLFLSAGAVVHATGTRAMDELGGLIRVMPRTALLFLVGAAAICGLPPLNGFISELFIYLGFLRGAETSSRLLVAAAGVGGLGLIGGLALACFTKVFGAVFLGQPRNPAHTGGAHEAPREMLGAMAVLAFACAFIGLLPGLVAPLLDRAVAVFAGKLLVPSLRALAPLGALNVAGATILLVSGLVGVLLLRKIRQNPVRETVTWDCGYSAPSTRMQYTASSFADILVSLFAPFLRPSIHRPAIQGFFPSSTTFASHVPEVVLDKVVRPFVARVASVFSWFRWIQSGSIHAYLLYIVLTLLGLHLFRA